jgi:hypothetical protein
LVGSVMTLYPLKAWSVKPTSRTFICSMLDLKAPFFALGKFCDFCRSGKKHLPP